MSAITVDDVIAALQADTNGSTGFADLMTGGVYGDGATDPAENVGDAGISYDTAPNAFDTDLVLKHCALVKLRDAVGDGQIQDVGVKSYRQVVEVWMYAPVSATWATIETASERALAVLDEQRIGSSSMQLFWIGDYARGREADLGDALRLRSDFAVRAVRGV